MINQCPACDSPVADAGSQGHCVTCGWEFVAFVSSFDEGQKLLKKRIALIRSYLQELRKGNEEDKQEIEGLKTDLKEVRELLLEKGTEMNSMQEKITKLKEDLDQAIEDQNFILLNQNYRGHRIYVEYWANGNGDIHLETNEPVSKLPTVTMIIKRGDVFVADPRFGSDGTYAGIINPNMWRAKGSLSFSLESTQMSRIFPCLAGNYTFSLAAALPRFNFNRKGLENDLSYVQLKFQ